MGMVEQVRLPFNSLRLPLMDALYTAQRGLFGLIAR